MNEFRAIVTNIEPKDFLDIFVVSLMFFGVFLVLRQTRSAVAMRGMIAVLLGSFIVSLVAISLRLSALTLLFRSLWVVAVLGFLIVFQNEFRRALSELGRMPLLSSKVKRTAQSLNEVIAAVERMSQTKTGALIALEQTDALKVYADTGTYVDAAITSDLIRTIFANYTPLHDGAIVVRGDRVVAAGCILPLTENPPADPQCGLRHRAGIGLSEETDAIIIVVSEETGTISIVHKGNMERHLTPEALRERMQEILDIPQSAEAAESHES